MNSITMELTALVLDISINALDHFQPEEAAENLRRISLILKGAADQQKRLLGLGEITEN